MVFAVHHEQLVGVVRQLVEAAQVAQHDLEADVLADGHHVEVHQRADRVLRVGHRRPQLFASLAVERLEHVLHDLGRQVGSEVGEFVRIEGFGGGLELLRIHRLDQRLAYCIGHFEQDLAVALGLDQIPYEQPVLERQGLEDERDVGRVQFVEAVLQFGYVLLVNQVFHQVMAWHFLAVHEILHHFLARQQLLHFAQVMLDVVRMMFLVRGHGFPCCGKRVKGEILRTCVRRCDRILDRRAMWRPSGRADRGARSDRPGPGQAQGTRETCMRARTRSACTCRRAPNWCSKRRGFGSLTARRAASPGPRRSADSPK